MADDAKNAAAPLPAFDLQKAIADARAEFAGEADGFTFVDLAAPDAARQFREWLAETDSSFQQVMSRRVTLDQLAEAGAKNLGFCCYDPVTCKTFIGVRSSLGEHRGLLGDEPKSLAYIFAHEFGHAICPGGLPVYSLQVKTMGGASSPSIYWRDLAEVNGAENTANSFAAIYGLAKGWYGLDDISHYSAVGATESVLGCDFTHFSSIALDRIVLGADINAIRSLTPREMRMIASRHAYESAASEEALKSAIGVLHPLVLQQIDDEAEKKGGTGGLSVSVSDLSQRLIDAFHHAPHHSLEYFLARKLLADLAGTGTLPGLSHQFNTSGQQWVDLRLALEQAKQDEKPGDTIAAFLKNQQDVTVQPGAPSAPVQVTLNLRR